MKQMQYALTVALCFLLYPATSFSMLERARRQDSQRRIEKYANSMQTTDQVNCKIAQMKENASRKSIQELAHITGKPYEALKTQIDLERDITKEILKIPTPHPLATHDPRIPAPLYKTMCTTMQDEGLNPHSVKLTYKTDSQDTHLLADSRGFIFANGFPIGLLRSAPKIQFYPPLSQGSQADQFFTCGHELWHILLLHNSMGYIARTHNPNTDTERLYSLREQEADVYAASKNKEIAHAAAIARCTVGRHAAIVENESHCQQMQMMYALLKRKDELSKDE